MQKFHVTVLAALALFLQCEARVFSVCELVYELRRQGFPEHELRDWVCLVQRESGGDTSSIGKLNQDGSWDYGIFQINSRYWCSQSGSPGLDCNITCDELLTDDITVASNCAKKIYQRHGFSAWVAWNNYCQGGLPDISYC